MTQKGKCDKSWYYTEIRCVKKTIGGGREGGSGRKQLNLMKCHIFIKYMYVCVCVCVPVATKSWLGPVATCLLRLWV